MTKPILILTVACLCLAGPPGVSGATAQEVPRMAVLELENQTSWWGRQLGDAAASVLTTRLVRSGDYSMIERDQLDAILEEQGLEHSGIVNPEQAVDIGRIAGLHYVVLGAVTRFGVDRRTAGAFGIGASVTEAESALTIRVVSTETGEIVAAAEAEGSKRLVGGSFEDVTYSESSDFSLDLAREALEPAIDELIEQLGEQEDRMAIFEVEAPLPAAQVVGLGSAGDIYINRGENAGVEVGQRFAVMRVMDEIVDAEGNVLDVITEQVALLEVTRVLSQSAICSLVEGEAPAEGDQVEPTT